MEGLYPSLYLQVPSDLKVNIGVSRQSTDHQRGRGNVSSQHGCQLERAYTTHLSGSKCGGGAMVTLSAGRAWEEHGGGFGC